MEDYSNCGLWIFLDDRYFYIESKKSESEMKSKWNDLFSDNFKLQLDIGKLIGHVSGNRQIAGVTLYGPEPQSIDTWWSHTNNRQQTDRNGGWKVCPFERKQLFIKEKQLVATIASDITELISYSTDRQLPFGKYKNKIALITSDTSFLPVLQKVIEQDGWWQIEIWASFERWVNVQKLHCSKI